MIQNKKILIYPKLGANLDTLLSASVLTEILSKQNNVDLHLTSSRFIEFLKKNPLEKSRIINKFPERKYKISMDNSNSGVKNIQWQQNENNTDIYIEMEKGKLELPKTKIDLVRHYDNVIFVGFEQDSIDDQILNNIDMIDRAEVINFGRLKNIDNIKNYTAYFNYSYTTIAEAIFDYLKKESIKIDQYIANQLLSAIFAGTNRFSIDVGANTYNTAAELTSFGAKNTLVNQTLSFFNSK